MQYIRLVVRKVAVSTMILVMASATGQAGAKKSDFDIGKVKRLEGEAKNEGLIERTPATPQELRQQSKREAANELESLQKLEVERDLRERLR